MEGDVDFNKLQIAVFQELSLELPAGKVHYMVSSQHLKLASPIFAEMLSPQNWVGSKGERDGYSYIVIDDCDEEAMLILLNIIHLRNRQVPLTVDLETLAKFAVSINQYKCYEETEMFTNMWIAAVTTSYPPPKTYCRELVLWLLLAWVFRLRTIFEEVSGIAVEMGTDGSLRTMGLPIPAPVVGQRYLSMLIAVQMLTKYR